MSNINDGGPAFPFPIVSQNQTTGETSLWQTEGGMTLRDYFAAAALQGYIANYAGADVDPFSAHARISTAKRCYAMADEMIAERNIDRSERTEVEP